MPCRLPSLAKRGDPATQTLIAEVWKTGRQDTVLAVMSSDADLPTGHPATGKGQIDGVATAYVCEGPVCSLPVNNPDDLGNLLDPAEA